MLECGGQRNLPRSIDSFSDIGEAASLRTNVGAECKVVHDRVAWAGGMGQRLSHRQADRSPPQGGVAAVVERLTEEMARAIAAKVEREPRRSARVLPRSCWFCCRLIMTTARGVRPSGQHIGRWSSVALGWCWPCSSDIALIGPLTSVLVRCGDDADPVCADHIVRLWSYACNQRCATETS